MGYKHFTLANGWSAAYVCSDDRSQAVFTKLVGWATTTDDTIVGMVAELEDDSGNLVEAPGGCAWAGVFLGYCEAGEEGTFHDMAKRKHDEEERESAKEVAVMIVDQLVEHYDLSRFDPDKMSHVAWHFSEFFGTVRPQDVPREFVEAWLTANVWRWGKKS